MKKYLSLFEFLIVVFILCFISCSEQKECEKYIRENFNEDEIRFFGESTCFNDVSLINDSLRIVKWDSDIYIKTFGKLTSSDSLGVENAISELNNLDLPIKAHWKKDSPYFNYEFHFVDQKELDSIYQSNYVYCFNNQPSYFGKGTGDSITTHEKIYILQNEAETGQEFQLFVILHEFINSLGLHGDTYSNIESVLYDVPMDTKRSFFSEIDKKALRLLYSPAIPHGMIRSDFLRQFSDIFKDDGVAEKDYIEFEKYIKEHNISESVINTLLTYGFNEHSRDGKFYIIKWKTTPVIQYQDDVYKFQNLKMGVDSINSYLPDHLKIRFAEKGKNYNISFRLGKPILNCNIARTGLQMVCVQIDDTYFNSDEKDPRLTARLLMETTGIYPLHDHPSFHLSALTDPEFMYFFYSPVIKSGMEKEKLVEIIQKHYNLNGKIEQSYKQLENYISKRPLSDSIVSRIRVLMKDKSMGDRVHKWDSIRMAYTDYHQFDQLRISKMMSQLLPKMDFRFTSIDSCNLLIKPNSNIKLPWGFGNTIGISQSIFSSLLLAQINDKQAMQNTFVIHALIGSILNSANLVLATINTTDGYAVTLMPYWKEVFDFYYSPYVVSGMEKDRILKILSKYYS